MGAVEDAIVVATRKYYKTQENLRAELDKETGQIRAYAVRSIVETPEQIEDPIAQITLEEAKRIDPAAEIGGELRTYKPTDVLGRIAAQLAKQVIFQKVREAERDTVYNEYIGRVGEIINATVKRTEGQDVIVDLGKAEGRMPRKEQSRLESFAPGERVRVVIVRVEKASKGPQVVVSRAVPELVTHLFQTEVPEIYDNTVVIRAIAREAGERTKIAVMSKDKDVDPVGACVGMKGMRVQSIIRELRGEKIDIIEYPQDPVVFAEKALQPAKVSRVTVLEGQEKHLEVIVDDSQLSLAIGKKGQNVRLAAKLLGWKIDIKSEEEKRQEVEEQMRGMMIPQATPLESVPDLEPGIIEKLVAAGITTVEAVADMTPEQLEEVPGHRPQDRREDQHRRQQLLLQPGGRAKRRGGRRRSCCRRNKAAKAERMFRPKKKRGNWRLKKRRPKDEEAGRRRTKLTRPSAMTRACRPEGSTKATLSRRSGGEGERRAPDVRRKQSGER